MSRSGMLVASIIAVGLIGLGLYQFMPASQPVDPGAENSPANEGNGSIQPPPAGSVSVTAEPARRGELVKRITANGVAEAERLLTVVAEVAGKVDSVAVVEGQWVGAGDLLVALDDAELRMARDQAEDSYNKRIMDFANNQIDLGGSEVRSRSEAEGS